MKVEKSFSPITIVIETEKELNDILGALQSSMNAYKEVFGQRFLQTSSAYNLYDLLTSKSR